MGKPILDGLAHIVCDIPEFHGGPCAKGYCGELGRSATAATQNISGLETVTQILN
jgi:hypothetical protein